MQRNKGLGFERELVHAFQDAGIHAERVPLSGAAGGSYTGDVTAVVGGQDRTFEAKRRADGFAMLYRWLARNYGLLLRSDREASLVVLRLSDFIDLAKLANSSKQSPAQQAAFERAVKRGMFRGLNAPKEVVE